MVALNVRSCTDRLSHTHLKVRDILINENVMVTMKWENRHNNFVHTLWILHIVSTMQVLGVVCVLSANKSVKGDYYIYYFYISI
jgi:hypothetical protein